MLPLEVLPGTNIIQQGDIEASKFYILQVGSCEVVLKLDNDESNVVHQYKAGRCAGPLTQYCDDAYGRSSGCDMFQLTAAGHSIQPMRVLKATHGQETIAGVGVQFFWGARAPVRPGASGNSAGQDKV